MQFLNSSLDKLVKNLSDEDFKYLVEEFCCESLELLRQKDTYPYEYMNIFGRFNEEKLPAKNISLVQQKNEKLVIMVKYQTVT